MLDKNYTVSVHTLGCKCWQGQQKHSSMTLPVVIVIIIGGRGENTSIFHGKFRQTLHLWGISLACLAESEKGQETHLAALTGTDTIVVPWGLVLAHKAGFVDAGRRGRRRRAWHYLFWAGTLGLYGCEEEEQRKWLRWRTGGNAVLSSIINQTHALSDHKRGDFVLLDFRVAAAKSPESIYGEHLTTCTHVHACVGMSLQRSLTCIWNHTACACMSASTGQKQVYF